MLQQDVPADYVIATGETNTLQNFVQQVFEYLNLDWKFHVSIDASLNRPSEIMVSKGNPLQAEKELG